MQKKIAVIGGGISGLTTAYYLQQHGHLVTLFEKELRVGGKCLTLKSHTNICELGCIFGAASHKHLLKLMGEVGIPNEGTYFYRSFATTQGKRIAQVETEQLARFKVQYNRLPEILKKYEPIISKPGLTEIPAEFCVSFTSWCEQNGIDLLPAIFAPPFTGFGYGRLDEIPAAYALKHFDISTLTSFVNVRKIISFPDGASSLCEKLADLIDDIRLNAQVTRIDTGACVRVVTATGTERFDAVVLTVPLPSAATGNTALTQLFAKYQYVHYNTFAYTVAKPPRTNTYIPENFNKGNGHLLVYFNRNPQAKSSVITGYSYGDMEVGRLKSIMDEDLKKAGINPKALFAYRKWKNFPHVTCGDLRDGFYDKLNALQGVDGIYCAGGLVCFPNFDKLIEYSNYFADKYF